MKETRRARRVSSQTYVPMPFIDILQVFCLYLHDLARDCRVSATACDTFSMLILFRSDIGFAVRIFFWLAHMPVLTTSAIIRLSPGDTCTSIAGVDFRGAHTPASAKLFPPGLGVFLSVIVCWICQVRLLTQRVYPMLIQDVSRFSALCSSSLIGCAFCTRMTSKELVPDL